MSTHKDNTKTIPWRLGPYVIEDSNKGLAWGTWHEDNKILYRIVGRGWIQKGVLILSHWKVRETEKYSAEEIEKDIKKFPKWNKTKYFIEMMDIGPTHLRSCKTLKIITPERVVNKIIHKLGCKNTKIH